MSEMETQHGIVSVYYDASTSEMTLDDAIKSIMKEKELPEEYESWIQYFYEYDFYDREERYIINKDKGIIYKIESEKLGLGDSFILLKKNEDDTFTFLTQFYNGGTYLEEMVSDALVGIGDNKEYFGD